MDNFRAPLSYLIFSVWGIYRPKGNRYLSNPSLPLSDMENWLGLAATSRISLPFARQKHGRLGEFSFLPYHLPLPVSKANSFAWIKPSGEDCSCTELKSYKTTSVLFVSMHLINSVVLRTVFNITLASTTVTKLHVQLSSTPMFCEQDTASWNARMLLWT